MCAGGNIWLMPAIPVRQGLGRFSNVSRGFSRARPATPGISSVGT